jgi:hypothetical protein
MKTPLIAICLLAAAALLSACSTQPVVSAQSRQGVDMRAFKTYAFKPGAGADAAGITGISSAHVMAAVRMEMDARGYVYAASNPDLLVDFNSGVFSRPKTNHGPRVSLGAFGSYGGVSLDVPVGTGANDEKVIRIGLEMLDAQRREAVWEGVYESALQAGDAANPSAAIQNAVHGMFTRFPIK